MQIDENAQYDHNTELRVNAENFATEKLVLLKLKEYLEFNAYRPPPVGGADV